jgi:hypothetical protein
LRSRFPTLYASRTTLVSVHTVEDAALRLAGRILGSIGRLIAVVAVIGLIVFVNGGYVYKTSCARADGHIDTSWQYRISDFIPYLGHTVSGCASHTATRQLLSAVGIWKLASASHGGQAAMTSTDYSVELRADINSVTGIYQDEEARAANIKKAAGGGAKLNPAEIVKEEQTFALAYASVIAKMRTDAPPSGVDPDLKRMWAGFIEYGTLHRKADLELASDLVAHGTVTSQSTTATRHLARQLVTLSGPLLAASQRARAKYPALR